MTQQYNQNNINLPRLARQVSSDTALNFDDDIVVVDTSGGSPVTLTLPPAQQIPGQTIVVKATTASVASVTVQAGSGNTVDVGNVVLTADQEAAVFRSLDTVWYLICCLSTGAEGCTDPVVVSVSEPFPGTTEIRGVQFGSNPVIEAVDPATGAVTVPTIVVLPDVGGLNVIQFNASSINQPFFMNIRDGSSNCINDALFFPPAIGG